jgi:hypothetical protein
MEISIINDQICRLRRQIVDTNITPLALPENTSHKVVLVCVESGETYRITGVSQDI